jgi:stage V sporulation protein B
VKEARKFTLDIGWGLVGSVSILVAGFFLRVILARWLGAVDLGLYTMIVTVHGIAIAGIILYTLSSVLASVFNMPGLARLLKILALALPLFSLLETVLALLNGLRQMKTYSYLMILRSLLMILLTTILVWRGFGVEGAVLGMVLAVLGGCVLGLYFSSKYLRLSIKGFVQNAKILTYTDIILIGYFLSAEDVGYYGIAVSLSTLFLIIPQAIQRISYPATSEYWSQNNRQALSGMIDKSMRYSACVLLPLGLGVGFFAKEIVTLLFGQEFIHAVLPFCVLLIIWVIRASTIVPVGGCYSGVGRPDLVLKFSAISAGANIGLNILLIPPFGILGAAIATAVSLLLGSIVFLVLMPRILGVMIDIKWYGRAMGFACIALILFLAGTQWINPFIIGSVILCGYIMLIVTTLLTEDDKAILRSLAFELVSKR